MSCDSEGIHAWHPVIVSKSSKLAGAARSSLPDAKGIWLEQFVCKPLAMP
jgi:hypothetical protein